MEFLLTILIVETKTYAESSSNYFQGVDSGEEFILEEIYQDMIEQEIKNNEKNTEQNQNELLQHSRYEKLEDEMKNEVNESIEDSLLIQGMIRLNQLMIVKIIFWSEYQPSEIFYW